MGNDFDTNATSLVFDTPLKKPPKLLFYVAITSISIGTALGIFGLYGINTAILASNSQQYLVGLVGYILTALLPIVMFQLFISRHSSLSKNSKDEPYDNYAGLSTQNIFKKVLALGLVTAAMSVWVFLQPIAERFA